MKILHAGQGKLIVAPIKERGVSEGGIMTLNEGNPTQVALVHTVPDGHEKYEKGDMIIYSRYENEDINGGLLAIPMSNVYARLR